MQYNDTKNYFTSLRSRSQSSLCCKTKKRQAWLFQIRIILSFLLVIFSFFSFSSSVLGASILEFQSIADSSTNISVVTAVQEILIPVGMDNLARIDVNFYSMDTHNFCVSLTYGGACLVDLQSQAGFTGWKTYSFTPFAVTPGQYYYITWTDTGGNFWIYNANKTSNVLTCWKNGVSQAKATTIKVYSDDTFIAQECGNSIVEGTEYCDDGALNGIFPNCSSDCTGVASRSFGVVSLAGFDSGSRQVASFFLADFLTYLLPFLAVLIAMIFIMIIYFISFKAYRIESRNLHLLRNEKIKQSKIKPPKTEQELQEQYEKNYDRSLKVREKFKEKIKKGYYRNRKVYVRDDDRYEFFGMFRPELKTITDYRNKTYRTEPTGKTHFGWSKRRIINVKKS